MIFKPSSRIFVLPTELEVPLAKPMDSTGGEIVLDQRRQPTVRALFYRERRRHWGGKTSPRGTTGRGKSYRGKQQRDQTQRK